MISPKFVDFGADRSAVRKPAQARVSAGTVQERKRGIGSAHRSKRGPQGITPGFKRHFLRDIVSGFENLQIQRIHPAAQREIFLRVKAGLRKVHEKPDSQLRAKNGRNYYHQFLHIVKFIRNYAPSAKPRQKERQIGNNALT